MVNYLYDCYQVLNKVYSDGAYLKQAINTTPIEEKNKSLTVKTCYGVVERDIELSYYLKSLCPKSPKASVKLVLKISMYAIKYLEKKPYAVIDNAVSLIKKMGKTGVSGFVNAVLRKFVTQKIDLPKNKISNLSIKYSYPEFAVQELIDGYGEETAEKIMQGDKELTTLVFETPNAEDYLTEKGYSFTKLPYENAYIVNNFIRNADYDDGLYTYQGIGSLAICDAVTNGETLYDCCSAPGGKSVRLSNKFTKIIAGELHPHRAELIKTYISRLNRTNIEVIVADATEYNPSFEQKFSAVLADVPCSGFGTVKENPDIKLNKTKESLIELNLAQQKILNTVKNYVQKGGYLYYSTCSVFVRENYAVVEKFLQENKDFIIEKIDAKIPSIDFNGAKQFLPHISLGAGFFVAKLKRKS